MTRRYIHYEAAFEDYLRSCGLPYIAVDEHRKAIFAGNRVKSFDFLVYRKEGGVWLTDIKGRMFPYEIDGQKRYWENWVTEDDLAGLAQWQEAFGEGFTAMFVFAYVLMEPFGRQPTEHLHTFRDELYAFMCISLEDYRRECKQRSPKWGTVTVPVSTFKRLAKPVHLA